MLSSEKFTARVGVFVLRRTRYVNGPRSNERNQLVLINGQQFLAIVVLAEIAAVPVREVFVDKPDRFAKDPLAERRPTATRVVGNHHGKARIDGTGPQRRFT